MNRPDTEHDLPEHVLKYLREDMRVNPPRRVEDFETPQGRAARAEWLRKRQDSRDRQFWRICKASLVFGFFLLALVIASHAAPNAIASLADPLAHNPY